MIKEMLKTAGVNNMDDFYKLHPTEEHFFKTYPHMKNKMKKKIRKPRYQPGGVTPFTDFAAANAQANQAVNDQAAQAAAQQYLYQHPVYPTTTGTAPGTPTLPQVTVTAPQQPFYYKSPKEVYQDFYTNVAPDYPLRSISQYQQSYANLGIPPQYDMAQAENQWRDAQHLKNISPEEVTKRYQDYLAALQFNHSHADQSGYDRAMAEQTFDQGPYLYRPTPVNSNNESSIDWNKVQQGFQNQDYNTDARTRSNMNDHLSYPFIDNVWQARGTYRDSRAYDVEKAKKNPPVAPSVFEQEYAMGGKYQKGGANNQAEMQQLLQAVSQAFQKGASPEQIIKSLMKQGVPQDTAIQMLKIVVDQAENGGVDEQSQPMNPEGMQEDAQQTYAKGGIHINPAKKGTFTAQATRMGMGVQEAARHILANKDRYSPGMVKKANFARNASKWKHEYGGYAGMYQEGGETMGQEQMEGAPQQMQEQAMGQEQQGGQEQMMQQLAQMVAQALQQGMDPQQIVQMLVQQGVPQEVATQVVQMVMQQMGGGAPQQMQGNAPQGGPGQQYQSQAQQYQGPQQPQAKMGGYFADGGFFNESYMPFDY